MSDPLYRREILRLAADATGAGTLARADGRFTAHNPACADKVAVEVEVKDGRITALAHQTQACILTQAAAAILGAAGAGQDAQGLSALEESVRTMLEGGAAPSAPFAAFAALDAVGAVKGRHACVLLPIKAARGALENALEATEKA